MEIQISTIRFQSSTERATLVLVPCTPGVEKLTNLRGGFFTEKAGQLGVYFVAMSPIYGVRPVLDHYEARPFNELGG